MANKRGGGARLAKRGGTNTLCKKKNLMLGNISTYKSL